MVSHAWVIAKPNRGRYNTYCLCWEARQVAPGDLVQGMWGWELYSVARTGLLKRILPSDGVPLEAYLSIFSHVGHPAAAGMIEVGRLRPGWEHG